MRSEFLGAADRGNPFRWRARRSLRPPPLASESDHVMSADEVDRHFWSHSRGVDPAGCNISVLSAGARWPEK